MSFFQEVSHASEEYTAFNPDYARDFPTPDTLESRQRLVNGIEQNLRNAYGSGALAGYAERTRLSLEGRKADLAYALSKTYYRGKDPSELRGVAEREGIMPAIAAREQFEDVAFTLGTLPSEGGENMARFVTEAEDGSLRSSAVTEEGKAVTAMLTFIHERAPEVLELARQAYPFTQQDPADDPNRRLFFEHAASLFSLKPPEEIQRAFPDLQLWNRVFEGARRSMVHNLLSKEAMKERYLGLFERWKEVK